jgi:stage V sporulation protein G
VIEIVVSEIQIVPIKPQNGLCGFATCVIGNQFFVGNIGIYSSPSSKDGFRLVFPNKKLASGQVVDCFHPINKEAEQQVTSAIVRRYLGLMDNFHYAE